MGGQRKTATESQTDTFQELVVLLVGSDVKFVVIPFQNLLDIGKDRVMNSSPTFILCPPM